MILRLRFLRNQDDLLGLIVTVRREFLDELMESITKPYKSITGSLGCQMAQVWKLKRMGD